LLGIFNYISAHFQAQTRFDELLIGVSSSTDRLRHMKQWLKQLYQTWIPHSQSRHYVHMPRLPLGKPPDPQTSQVQTLTSSSSPQSLSESWTTNGCFGTHWVY